MKTEGKIKDACIVIAGQSPKGSSYNEKGEGLEFHQGKKAFGESIIEHSNVRTTEITKIAEPGDILMSVRAPVGPTNLTDRKICIGRGLAAIRCNREIIPQYILYALRNIESKIIGNDGAVFNSINKNQIEDLPLPILSLSEQQRIVDYLDAAFAKIDAMKANAEKALNEAKALFQASLKEMLEPKEGWEEKTLPDISENLDSKRKPVTKGKREAGIYPYYGASGIVDYVSDYIFDEDILLISEDGANLVARSTPIAFSVSGKVWVNNHAHILKFQNIYTQYFVEYYFASNKIDEYVTGAAQPKFSQKNMNKLPIWIPSLSEQQSIVATLDSLKSKVDRLQANCEKISQECDALKQAILRQVFE